MCKPARGPFAYGEPWWLDDPIEMSADRFRGRRRQLCFLLGVAASCAGVVAYTSHAGVLVWSITPATFGQSSFVLLPALVVYRIACAAFIFGICASKLVSDYVLQRGAGAAGARLNHFETLDRTEVAFLDHGVWRFQGLTSWGWVLLGCYFLVAATLSLRVAAAPEAAQHEEPDGAACVASLLLGVSSAYAILITLTVTFVLIPSKHRKGLSTEGFFTPFALSQHNANLAMVVGELLCGAVPIDPWHLPFALGFGIVYLCGWHQTVRYNRTRTLMYHFLNWQHPRSLLICSLLMLTLAAFFAFAALVGQLRLRPGGAPMVLCAALAVMRWRRPPPLAGKGE